MRSAIVLGAGMVGVCTALHLQRRGFAVTLIDRRGAGEETSHGNAGIIQSEAVEPYPMPRDPLTLARVAIGAANDVRYRVAALPGHISPLLRYWWNSEPGRHAEISKAYASLIVRAVEEHQPFIAEAGAEDLIGHDGYLMIHRRERQFEDGIAKAKRAQAEHGVPYKLLTPDDVRALEPSVTGTLVGGIHWTGAVPVSDPGRLVKLYEQLFEKGGGTFATGEAESLKPSGSGWKVETTAGPIEAEIAVVALGPWAPEFLERFGYRFSLVRKRGYHRHFAGGAALSRPLFDMAYGFVIAPMARGLRITTGAEFTGRDSGATPVQLVRAERAARELLDLGTSVDPEPWFGTRPFLAGMLPVIGEAPKHKGLWFHFGHGHQGFTLGPASGRLLAELVTGERPSVDPAPFLPKR